MPLEKSAGGVVFCLHRGKVEYLLLKNKANCWLFPKGLVEEGEKDEEAALREIREETGLENLLLIPGFKEQEKYFFSVKYDYQLQRGWRSGEKVFKIVTYFLFKTKNKKIKLSFEHIDYCWLSFNQAREKITYAEAKKILEKANKFILLKQKTGSKI